MKPQLDVAATPPSRGRQGRQAGGVAKSPVGFVGLDQAASHSRTSGGVHGFEDRPHYEALVAVFVIIVQDLLRQRDAVGLRELYHLGAHLLLGDFHDGVRHPA
eukprot:6739363-Prymnesium_polylepis.1